MSMALQVTEIIKEVLQIESSLDADSTLLGGIPEFDSMAVVTILTVIEEQFGILIDDDEVDASIFETVGSLTSFVEQKI